MVDKILCFITFMMLLFCFGPLYLFFVMVLFAYDDAKPEEFVEYGATAPFILGKMLRSWKNG